MQLDILLMVITFLVLFIGSYTDLKRREVPDWLNYGLIFAALGIRTIFSFEYGWQVLFSGVLGFLICLAIAFLFYYSGQWGGGDSKLLMGMGAVIGVTLPLNNSSLNLLWFMLSLLFLGSIFGILWMLVLAIRKRHLFWKNYQKYLKKRKTLHLLLAITTIIFIVLTFFKPFIWPMIPFPLLMFYLFSFVNIVEKNCFYKQVPPYYFTEGDWLAKDVVINKKNILTARTLEMEDVWKLRFLESHNKLNEVTIKEGVPFVPSFLLGYLALLFGSKFISFLFLI